MRKQCSKWVQRLLTVDQKQQSVKDSGRCLQLFQCNKIKFLCKYVNEWNMDQPLHFRVKSAVSWVDSSRWKPSKAIKDANISRQVFGLHILGCARYFVQQIFWLFYQDNTTCHKSIVMITKLHELHFEWLLHPPYSPVTTGCLQTSKKCSRERDLAPMKKWKIGISETEVYFEAKDKAFYKKCIKLFEKSWKQCKTLERDYVDE